MTQQLRSPSVSTCPLMPTAISSVLTFCRNSLWFHIELRFLQTVLFETFQSQGAFSPFPVLQVHCYLKRIMKREIKTNAVFAYEVQEISNAHCSSKQGLCLKWCNHSQVSCHLALLLKQNADNISRRWFEDPNFLLSY